MTVQHKHTATRVAFIGIAVGLAVAGCGSDSSSSSGSSSSSSSAASSSTSAAADGTTGATPAGALAPADLVALLMKPESVPPSPDGPWVGEEPKVDQTPRTTPDAKRFYTSGSHNFSSQVLVLPDAAAAATTVQGTMTGPEIAAQIKGTAVPAPTVTPNAMVINGTSADGSASMSILMFSEGRVAAQLTFIDKLNDAVPADFLNSVGTVQLDAIKQGLPKLG